MAKNDSSKTATTATATKDRSSYSELADSFMWRGASALSDLVGRVVATDSMDTRFKTPENPGGTMDYTLILTTEPSSWKAEDGSTVECPAGSEVKVPASANLAGLLHTARNAIRAGKAPEVVVHFTGKTMPTRNGPMKVYKVNVEPKDEWPALAVIAPQHVPFDFEVTQLTDGAPAPKQLNGSAS